MSLFTNGGQKTIAVHLVDLFDRDIRPPRLNANGEGVVGKARELVDQFNDFKSTAAVKRVRGRLSGRA